MNNKVRIYDLAKKLNKSNKELMALLEEMGVPFKSHSSSIDSETAQTVEALIAEGAKAATEGPAQPVSQRPAQRVSQREEAVKTTKDNRAMPKDMPEGKKSEGKKSAEKKNAPLAMDRGPAPQQEQPQPARQAEDRKTAR
ncbi:MAG: translation initiation factor IF-2 N-terminal domain-containing protein, partial [Fretibacterium sp.]|nr:translation initiation factor IF-2 N-terminal domain-containing protein [Fretibacterium sp.]